MIFLLYTATAATLLAIAHRFVQRISRIGCLLLFLIPFCLTGYAVFSDGVYGPVDFPYATEPLLPLRGQYGIGPGYNGMLSDVASQIIPWRKAVQWALAHHEWPLHNPFILCGDILAASAQPAAYSPFTLLACLLPVAKGLTYSAAITFFIAGLGAFLFARELGCRESAALVGAAAWMYSTAVSFFVLWPLGVSWTFLPLVLLAVRRVVRTPGTSSEGLLTTAFVLMLLSGHPETALHIVLLACLYAVFEIVIHRRNVIHSAVAGLGAGLLALLICAIYVLPIVDAAPQTVEHWYRMNVFAKQPRGATTTQVLARLATDFFPFLHVRHWNASELTPMPIDTAAVGSIAVALAIYAVWRVRSPDSWFFAAVAVFCLLARAEWGAVARALQKLPLFDVALNERLSFGAAFAFAILAGIGVEHLLRRQRDAGAAITATCVLVVIAIGTVMILRANFVGANNESWGEAKVFAELAGLAAVALVIVARVPPQWSAAAILGFVLLQRTVSESGVYKTFPARAAYPPVPLFEPLKRVREPFRVTGFNMTLIPGTSALYELEDPRGYEAMTLQKYADTYPLWSVPQQVWFNRVVDLTRPFLSFLNVRYAIVWSKFPVPDGWRIFATQRGAWLLENTHVLERAFVPRAVTVGLMESQALDEMMKQTDFGERAWISASTAPFERVNGPGKVLINRRGSRYELTADMQGDGWVVVSESAWRGWRAYLDGRRVRIQLANTAFLSVYVPKGKHRVRLVYKPQSFVVGRAISLFVLALLIAVFAGRAVLRLRLGMTS